MVWLVVDAALYQLYFPARLSEKKVCSVLGHKETVFCQQHPEQVHIDKYSFNSVSHTKVDMHKHTETCIHLVENRVTPVLMFLLEMKDHMTL